MPARARSVLSRLLLLMVCAGAASCGSAFGKRYEYEEDTTLALDGSAIVDINASIAALVALRGLTLDPRTSIRFDDPYVAEVRRQVTAMGCHVDRISSSAWYRDGRRFIQIRLNVPDINTANACGLLRWSTYHLVDDGQQFVYTQAVGAAAGGDPGPTNWDGTERVAFKLRLPSRISYHNVRDIDSGETGQAARGNILTWEQRLSDRRAGAPLAIEMHMERESILKRTMLLFGAAFVAALVVMAGGIWWFARRRPQRS